MTPKGYEEHCQKHWAILRDVPRIHELTYCGRQKCTTYEMTNRAIRSGDAGGRERETGLVNGGHNT